MPAVSVIIPFFNRAETLGRSIASVLAQSFTDFEIVCVDDGSVDASAQVVYGFSDARITLLQHGGNKGAAAARITGVNAAKGEWIAFLDSDDEWHADKLTLHMAALQHTPVDISFTDCMFEKAGVLTRYTHPVMRDQQAWAQHFLDGCYVSPGATMVLRRSVWQALGGLDERLNRLEDWDFLLRAALKSHTFSHVAHPLATVHLGEGWPKPASIIAATNAIVAKHARVVETLWGAEAARTLRASAELECAAACLRNGQRLRGAVHMLGVLQSPARFMRWWRR